MHFVKIDRRHRIKTPPLTLICARSSQSSGWVTLAALYQAQWCFVLSQAFYITQSRQAAEEIAQDVFAYAWQKGDSYDCTRGSLSAWLSMLCRSRAIDYLRLENRESRRLDRDVELDSIPDDQMSPDARHLSQLLRNALKIAMCRLPNHERQLLTMHYYSELSHAEIAYLTGLPLGTVKTTIRRAKLALGRSQTLCSLQFDS